MIAEACFCTVSHDEHVRQLRELLLKCSCKNDGCRNGIMMDYHMEEVLIQEGLYRTGGGDEDEQYKEALQQDLTVQCFYLLHIFW